MKVAALASAVGMYVGATGAMAQTGAPSPVPTPNSRVEAHFFSESIPVLNRAPTLSQTLAHAEVAKVKFGFADKLAASKVSIESCGEEWGDGVEFFFGPGQRRAFAEGGSSRISVAVPPDDHGIRTLTIHFRYNVAPCLRSIRITREGATKEEEVRLPSKVASPAMGLSIARLFDSDPSTATTIGARPLQIGFESSQTVERLLVWNGLQADDSAFKKSEPVSEITISSDDGSSEKYSLKQQSGMQEIRLKQVLQTSQIRVSADKSGSLSELRFGNSESWFVPSVSEKSTEWDELLSAFSEAGLAELIDREISTREEKGNWIFRLRRDKTFFIYGLAEELKVASRFVVIGSYQVVSGGKRKVRIRLGGRRNVAAQVWDGWMCGPACGERQSLKSIDVVDEIEIEKWPKGGYVIRNRTSARKRALPFTDLRVRVAHSAE